MNYEKVVKVILIENNENSVVEAINKIIPFRCSVKGLKLLKKDESEKLCKVRFADFLVTFLVNSMQLRE